MQHKIKPTFSSVELPLLRQGPQSFFPIVAIIQARMGSTRLPGKVLKQVLGKPLLEFLIERVRKVQHIDSFAVATTLNTQDDLIAEFCNSHSTHCFRGPEEDVLSRMYECAKSFDAEVVIRITADCPLLDPLLLSSAIYYFRSHFDSLDYFSNTLDRTYPRGMDIEIMRFSALEAAFFHAKKQDQREHVTPYIIEHSNQFRLGNFTQKINESDLRLTCDEQADFELIRRILEELYPKNPFFLLQDIRNCLETHPDWKKINAHIQQKT